jgi:hypothetical protein
MLTQKRLRFLMSIWLLLFIFSFSVAAQKQKTVAKGDFRFSIGSDWIEGTPSKESWSYLLRIGQGDDLLILELDAEPFVYRSEQERLDYIENTRKKLQNQFAATFKEKKARIAGVESVRWSFQNEGATVFTFVLFNAEKVFFVGVIDSRPNVAFPEQASLVLDTLKLAGQPYIAKAATPDITDKNKPIVGADKKPVIGADKKPVIGAENKPIIGADKKPIDNNKPSGIDATKPKTSVGETSKPKTPVGEANKATTEVVVSKNFESFSPIRQIKGGIPKNPDDPKEQQPANSYWSQFKPIQLPQIPAGTVPVALTRTLSLSIDDLIDYRAAVTAAKEAMRLIEGPMTQQESQIFEMKWAAYYAYPTREVIAYLNKLNPLLGDFLAARAGFNAASQIALKALMETDAALAYGNTFPAILARGNAEQAKHLMDAYQAKMTELVLAIRALGSPVNPLQEQARRKKRFNDEIAKLAAPKSKPITATKGRYYVLEKVNQRLNPRQCDKRIVCSFVSVEGSARGTYVIPPDKDGKMSFDGQVNYTPLQRLVPYSGVPDADEPLMINVAANFIYEFVSRIYVGESRDEILNRWGAQFFVGHGSDANSISDKSNFVTAKATAKSASSSIDLKKILQTARMYDSRSDTTHFSIVLQTPGGSAQYDYYYKLVELDQGQVAELEDKFKKEQSRAEKEQAQGIEQGKVSSEAAHQKADSIAYASEASRYFKEQYQREAAEYNQTTEPTRKHELMLRMMSADANRQAAEDNKTYLETGEFVRTRTLYDDYNVQRLIENSRAEAWRISEPDRVYKSTLAQINLMPKEKQQELLDYVNKQITSKVITSRDVGRYRDVNSYVAGRVRGYWEKERGDAETTAFVYRTLEISAQVTEVVAGIALLGTAGAALAEAEASSVLIWSADTLLGASYGGVTGYIEGGWDEATSRSLQWAGQVGFITSAALDGYAQTGTTKGAATYAGGAFLIGKVMEGGFNYLAGWYKGKPPRSFFNAEEYQLSLQKAKETVQRFSQAEKALADATASGVKGAKLAELQREADKLAAAINANWHAKFYLKHNLSAKAAGMYEARMERIFKEAEIELVQTLTKRGYNPAMLKFKALRNPSSIGTVSMDLDLALAKEIEEAILRGEIQLTRGGKRVSLRTFQDDAQKAMNDIYQLKTGFSAEQSFINITTAAHIESFTKMLTPEEGKIIDWSKISAFDRQRALEVLQAKVTGLNLPAHAKMLEACRAMSKEMKERFLPDLMSKRAQALRKGDKKALQALDESLLYWQDLQQKFEKIGKKELDPQALWNSFQEIQQETGKDVFEIAQTLGAFWEGLSKFAK